MSEPLPLVIIGLNFGRHICEELSKPENSRHVKLAGVCDLDASKAAELSSKYGIPA